MKKIKTQTEKISGRFGVTLATVVMLLVVFAGKAQEIYHPITDGCIWSVSNEKYMTAGDTVLDGKTYLKIYRHVGDQPFEFSLEDAEYFAAIRNDVAEKKVYVYLPAGTQVWDHNQGHHVTDTGMEVVLYDFSPQLGDYFSFYTICPSSHSAQEIYASRFESAYVLTGYENGYAHDTYYIDSDSLITMSDGTTRKRILLQTDGTIFEEVWIEGIGRLRGFDDFSIVEAEFPFRMLLCYSDSTGASYQTGFDFDGLDDCFNNGHGGGDVPEWEKLNFRAYPNPVTNRLHISVKQLDDRDFSVNIFNMMGICVHNETVSGTMFDKEIDLSFLPKGVYLVELGENKRHVTQKIIKL